MAEFIEVIKKKNEMCEYLKSCFDCPLSKNRCDTCYQFMKKEPKKAEELIMNWEPPVDWSKVEVDTPIYVRDKENVKWMPRYFARYKEGRVYAWSAGATSFTADGNKDVTGWNFAKLADKEA